jgi:hypothetical protein
LRGVFKGIGRIMERREQRAKALADQEAQPTLFTDLK